MIKLSALYLIGTDDLSSYDMEALEIKTLPGLIFLCDRETHIGWLFFI